MGERITSTCSSAEGVHAGLGKLIPSTVSLQIQSPYSEALQVLHVSKIAEQQAENNNGCLKSFQTLLCCKMGRLTCRQEQPRPTCCPAASTWVKGFSCVCGSGIQKPLFSVNGIKPLVRVCCFSHTWKQISSEATKHFSLTLKF